MPVHRHVHDKVGSVYAFRTELDAWSEGRKASPAGDPPPRPSADDGAALSEGVVEKASHQAGGIPGAADPRIAPPALRRASGVRWLAGTGIVLGLALAGWQLTRGDGSGPDPLAGAHFQQVTGLGGVEQAAAISRDGKFVTFLSDRDGPMDVWVSQIGTGQFHNLTRGRVPELVNPSVRILGFAPDGTLVTFWARKADGATAPEISVWAAPVLGGPARPYLEGVAEFDWSGDGSRLVYHTAGSGDPMFVQEGDRRPRQIFSAAPGSHAHFPVWSRDQAFIYFVLGAVPAPMDLWRIRTSGGTPERITNHDSLVSHPVFLDRGALMYLAGNPDGSGPSLYVVDVEQRKPRRVSSGVERYTSLAASANGRRLVATMASSNGVLWRLPVGDAGIDTSAAQRISLTTVNGIAPRLGPGFLLYVSSKGESDSIWKLQGDVASEVWSSPDTRILGGPAISRAGDRLAFVARRNRQASLYVANADGTSARILTSSLPLQGAPAWAPDGHSVAVSAVVDGSPRVFIVPFDGSAPRPLVTEHSVDPSWSHDGSLLVFSGPDIGSTFAVKMVTADGRASPHAPLELRRGSRHLAFLPGRRSLLVLRGEIGHKDLWQVDLDTGAEHQLTRFPADFNVRDFDISPDGREVVVEQAQEHSGIVLIDLQRR
jgi:Tol biopolymer transport system component